VQAYIIHDAARTDREGYVDAVRRLVPDVQVIQPFAHDNPMISCNLTHKYVLSLAQLECDKKDDRLCAAWVMEDDICFSPRFSLEHWTDLVHWLTISPYQLLLGGVATANDERKVATNIAEIKTFSSTHCYALRHDAINEVLKHPSEQHFDGLLTKANIRKVVTVPFLATQWPGHSTIRKRHVDDLSTFERSERQLLKAVNG
jgi:hypothetical protein